MWIKGWYSSSVSRTLVHVGLIPMVSAMHIPVLFSVVRLTLLTGGMAMPVLDASREATPRSALRHRPILDAGKRSANGGRPLKNLQGKRLAIQIEADLTCSRISGNSNVLPLTVELDDGNRRHNI